MNIKMETACVNCVASKIYKYRLHLRFLTSTCYIW